VNISGANQTANFTAQAPVVSVVVSPSTANLKPGASQQFTATVTGSTNKAVTWSLSQAIGTISSTGLYTAPGSTQSKQTLVLTAASAAAPTATAAATIILKAAVKVSGPAALPAGNTGSVGTAYTSVTLTAAGGTESYTWSATGLPKGLSVSSRGVLSGTPAQGSQGFYNPKFTVVDSDDESASATLPLAINEVAPSPAISSVNPNPVPARNGNQTLFINGSGFQNASGLRVLVTQPTGQTDLQGPQVKFLASGQLSIHINVGTTPANWTVQVINPDRQSSNTFSFAVAPTATTTTFALPQFLFGNGWYTAMYFSNSTDLPVNVKVGFYTDNGNPLSVPLLGIGPVSSQKVSVGPKSTVILEAPNSTGIDGQGWAEAVLPDGVVGYALLRQSVIGRPDRETVVPLTPETSQIADLIYDDVLFTTAAALVNPGNQSTTLTIAVAALDGSQIGSTQVTLGPRARRAVVLKELPGLAGIPGNRGKAVFTVTSGAISVLGLRFEEAAFRSIPVNHRSAVQVKSPSVPPAVSSMDLPQMVFGGGWCTTLYLSNATNAPTSFLVNFVGDDGTPINVPLVGTGTVSSQIVTLAPGATAVLEASNSLTYSVEGWANVDLPTGVFGYAVIRRSTEGRAAQEAVVPVTSGSSQRIDLIYDDTLFTTWVALSNPSDQEVTITATAYASDGVQLGSSDVTLPPHTKEVAALRSLPGMENIAGDKGWATFSVPNGAVSVLGLRLEAQAFTTIPASIR
jgi:hypothetical protein